MKKLLLLTLCITMSLAGRSQINYMFSMQYPYLNHVTYEHAGSKLIYLDNFNNQILIFGYNQSLYKTIDIVPPSPGYIYYIAYLTEDLFDTDPTTFEYMERIYDPTGTIVYTRIYREDGTLLFSRDSLGMSSTGALQNWNVDAPIYKRGNATIMRLTNSFTPNSLKKTEFYTLPGHLPNGLAPQEGKSASSQDDVSSSGDLSFAFPNPSSTYSKIYYQLPQGVSEGTLIVYDLNGTALKQFRVSDVFNYVTVTTGDLPSGSYTYVIQTSDQLIKGKEMVVIH